MKRKRRTARNDSAKKVVELAATAGATAAAGGTAVAVGAALVPGLAVWAADVLGRAMGGIADRRFRSWLEHVREGMNRGSLEEVQRSIETNLDKTWMRDGLLDGFRRLMDALDESVIPPLARLAAEYFEREQGPDVFLRSVGNMLVELDAAHLAALGELLARLYHQAGIAECRSLEIQRHAKDTRHLLSIKGFHPGVREAAIDLELEDHYPNELPRIFGLLKRVQLAGDNPGGFYGAQSGPHVLRLDVATLLQLNRIIAHSTRT